MFRHFSFDDFIQDLVISFCKMLIVEILLSVFANKVEKYMGVSFILRKYKFQLCLLDKQCIIHSVGIVADFSLFCCFSNQ